MATRTVKLILSFLMVSCIILIAISLSGMLTNELTEPSAGESTGFTNSTGQNTEPSSTENRPSFTELVPLPVDRTEPRPEPAFGLRRWPAASSIEILRQSDLGVYENRAYEQLPLQGITVFLDPGHGGQDGGTQYPVDSTPVLIEKDITLPVSLLARDKLEALGATVIMTRDEDIWLSLYSRAALVARELLWDYQDTLPYHGYSADPLLPVIGQLEEMLEINSDAANSGGRGIMHGPGASSDVRLIYDIQHQYPDALFISIHCNAYPASSQVRGLQVYYLTSETLYEKENEDVAWQESTANEPAYMLYADEERLRLAGLVRDEILNLLPDLRFTGPKDIIEANYAVLREINLPGILLEMGFITNEQDRQIFEDHSAREKIAEGIANAVYEYYCRP